jgi:uncharacterized membrane protein YozB (DUF420 family)
MKTTRPWYRRPWTAPLAVVAVAFIAYSLPPYLTFDPARSRITPPADLGWYYPLLVAHVSFASVAMTTCLLQVWPWFRARFPAVHRRVGRVYVFGGVLPAGLCALTIGAVSPFGPVARASNVLMASLWLTFTVVGFRMARQRRYVQHRRWMIRSFALTLSIITNRIWGLVAYLVLAPQLPATFHGDEKLFTMTIAGLTTWLGWTVTLLIAEWWLERSDAARRRNRSTARARQPVPAAERMEPVR